MNLLPEGNRLIHNPFSSFTHGGIIVAPDVGDYLSAAEGLLDHALR